MSLLHLCEVDDALAELVWGHVIVCTGPGVLLERDAACVPLKADEESGICERPERSRPFRTRAMYCWWQRATRSSEELRSAF